MEEYGENFAQRIVSLPGTGSMGPAEEIELEVGVEFLGSKGICYLSL